MINQLSLLCKSQHYNHLRTKNQLIYRLYNDVKNFTSVLSFCIGRKCVSSNDDTKAVFLCELHFSLIFTSRPLNHQRTNKQLVTLRYNDVKNFSSIFSCCNCVNIVTSKKDWKALYQWDNHFSLIFKRTNKLLTNLDYNDVKYLTSVLKFSRAPKFFLTMTQKLYLYVIITRVFFLYISALQSCGDKQATY